MRELPLLTDDNSEGRAFPPSHVLDARGVPAALAMVRRGAPKFVERAREVTFNGRRALAAGKRVFYATPVDLFQLTARGMELVRVMPGIDVRRDVLETASMRVVLPAAGEVPRIPRSVVTGEGFAPRLVP